MKTAVVVSSVNRPQVLHETVLALRRQTIPPLSIIVSLCDTCSVLPETSRLSSVKIVQGEQGLTRQRNAGLSAVPSGAEYVLFLDDDTELAPNYLESMERLFDGRGDLAVASAVFAMDGLRIGRPLSREEAIAAVNRQPCGCRTEPAEGITGCNIFVRRPVAESVRFDERLPLSGWLEDFDFSVRSRAHGRVVWNFETCAAHLGIQTGEPGTRVPCGLRTSRKFLLSLSEGDHSVIQQPSGHILAAYVPPKSPLPASLCAL